MGDPLAGDEPLDYSDLSAPSARGGVPGPTTPPPPPPPPHLGAGGYEPTPVGESSGVDATDEAERRAAGRAIAIAAGVVLIGFGGVLAVALVPADDGVDVTVEPVDSIEFPTTVVRPNGEPSATAPTDSTPGAVDETVPAAPVDLLADPSPALDAFAGIAGLELEVERIVVYPTYAVATVRDPQAPTNIDRYLWYEGREMTGPDPDRFTDADDVFFRLAAVPGGAFAGMVQSTADEFADLPGVQVGYLIVDTGFGGDGALGISVYASNPDRGGGGYVRFTPDGTIVRVVR